MDYIHTMKVLHPNGPQSVEDEPRLRPPEESNETLGLLLSLPDVGSPCDREKSDDEHSLETLPIPSDEQIYRRDEIARFLQSPRSKTETQYESMKRSRSPIRYPADDGEEMNSKNEKPILSLTSRSARERMARERMAQSGNASAQDDGCEHSKDIPRVNTEELIPEDRNAMRSFQGQHLDLSPLTNFGSQNTNAQHTVSAILISPTSRTTVPKDLPDLNLTSEIPDPYTSSPRDTKVSPSRPESKSKHSSSKHSSRHHKSKYFHSKKDSEGSASTEPATTTTYSRPCPLSKKPKPNPKPCPLSEKETIKTAVVSIPKLVLSKSAGISQIERKWRRILPAPTKKEAVPVAPTPKEPSLKENIPKELVQEKAIPKEPIHRTLPPEKLFTPRPVEKEKTPNPKESTLVEPIPWRPIPLDLPPVEYTKRMPSPKKATQGELIVIEPMNEQSQTNTTKDPVVIKPIPKESVASTPTEQNSSTGTKNPVTIGSIPKDGISTWRIPKVPKVKETIPVVPTLRTSEPVLAEATTKPITVPAQVPKRPNEPKATVIQRGPPKCEKWPNKGNGGKRSRKQRKAWNKNKLSRNARLYHELPQALNDQLRLRDLSCGPPVLPDHAPGDNRGGSNPPPIDKCHFDDDSKSLVWKTVRSVPYLNDRENSGNDILTRRWDHREAPLFDDEYPVELRSNWDGRGSSRYDAGSMRGKSPEQNDYQDRRLAGIQTCKLCSNWKIEVALFPCAHAALCLLCSGRIRQCPFCERPVLETRRIFLPTY